MKAIAKQETCFLCLKPLSRHRHGVKTIPQVDMNLLMSHWYENSSKLDGCECVCCDHFNDHDDLTFMFSFVTYPGLRQIEVFYMLCYCFLLK